MTPATRIAVNTIAQYFKTFINVILGFYSTRLVLVALGESDYGIYMLIAGVVGMLSFFNIALSVTTQRFLSYHQTDTQRKTIVFTNSLIIHVGAGLILFGALEVCGLFLFEGFLNIPADRLDIAKIIFHCAVLMIAVSVITSPFRAVLISRENIVFVSIIDILDGGWKVVIAWLITDSTHDRLLQFSLLTLGIYVFTFLSFFIYDYVRYPECKFPRISHIDKEILKKLTSFAGWSLYSSGCIIGRNQGISIVLNLFFGTILNAAYAIAFQVSGAVNYIGSAIQTSYSPRIIMTEGSGNRQLMLEHCGLLSKVSLLIMSMIGIPIFFCISGILSVWLKDVPDNTGLLCKVIILSSIIDQISSGLLVANRAIGKLKTYTIIVDSIKLLTCVALYILLIVKVPILYAIWVYAAFEFFSSIARMFVLRKNAGLNIGWWIYSVVGKSIIPITFLVVSWYLLSYRDFQLISFGFEFLIVSLLFATCCYLFSTSRQEKEHINNTISNLLCRLKQ